MAKWAGGLADTLVSGWAAAVLWACDVVDLCTFVGTVGCSMRAVGVLYDEIPVKYADW